MKIAVYAFFFAGAGIMCLSACAPSKEFQTVPQQGAWRSGHYPKFTELPRAETAQFSETDRQHLSDSLRAEGAQAERLARGNGISKQKERGSIASKKQADKEIENTLKHISGGA